MRSIFAFLIVLFCSMNLWAWGKTGHRIVGQIAQSNLQPKTILKLKELMGTESLDEASTWPDVVRSDPNRDFQLYWHYVSIEDGKTYEGPTDPKKGDIVWAMNEMVQILRGKATHPKVNKQQALRLLVHFVGDIHQPLHAGRPEDRGGNYIVVKFFKQISNLHEVWDENIIDFQHLSFTEYSNRLQRKFKKGDWQKDGFLTWVKESQDLRAHVYETSKDYIEPGKDIPLLSHQEFLQKYPGTWAKNYPDVDKIDPFKVTGVPEIGYQYIFRNLPTLEERLYKGGVRLAYILNEIL